MEYRNPPKKNKRQSTLALNKKGSRYYSHAKAEQSQTTSAESVLETHHSSEATGLVEVTHPVDLSTNIFASQSEHRENFVAVPHAPATTKYKKTFKQPRPVSTRKISKSVVTETVTSSNKNFQTFCGDTHDYKSPLCDSDFFHKFLQCLHNSKQLDDFNRLVQNLCNGCIPLHNLAWKSTLQIGQYFSCSTTTLMRYDPECVEFYACLYLLFGNSVLNVLHGPGHFSDVVTQNCGRGKYNPTTSKVNFAVPSLGVLQNVKTTYPKTIRPGLINYTLDTAEKDAGEGKQFVLSFDGKKIAQGVTGTDKGDVNLWGNENPPLVSEKLKLEKSLSTCSLLSNNISQCPKDSKHSTKEQHIQNIQKVAKINSLHLK